MSGADLLPLAALIAAWAVVWTAPTWAERRRRRALDPQVLRPLRETCGTRSWR